MVIRGTVVPVLVLVVTCFASCGGDDSDPAEPSADTPSSTHTHDEGATDAPVDDAPAVCDLVSTETVAAAVGVPVQAGVPSSGPAITGGSFDTCVWQSADPAAYGIATVTVYPNADAADSVREPDSETVEGVGTDAFSDAFSGLWVYVDDRSFFAQWYTLDDVDQDNLPQSTALAQAVVDAL